MSWRPGARGAGAPHPGGTRSDQARVDSRARLSAVGPYRALGTRGKKRLNGEYEIARRSDHQQDAREPEEEAGPEYQEAEREQSEAEEYPGVCRSVAQRGEANSQQRHVKA